MTISTKAMAMSDRVAVFNHGRIQQVAAPETLYEEPERVFVATFIGDNNLLHGRVLEIERDICTVDTGNDVVSAFLVAPRQVGDAVTLTIRPERVALAPTPGTFSMSSKPPSKTSHSWETICACE